MFIGELVFPATSVCRIPYEFEVGVVNVRRMVARRSQAALMLIFEVSMIRFFSLVQPDPQIGARARLRRSTVGS